MIKAFFKIFLTKGQGTGKSVRSVGYNVGFVISKFFFYGIFYYYSPGVKKIVRYTGDFVIFVLAL